MPATASSRAGTHAVITAKETAQTVAETARKMLLATGIGGPEACTRWSPGREARQVSGRGTDRALGVS
jgi:hypothetical protein